MITEEVCGKKWGKIATQIISDWKADEANLLTQHGSLRVYAIFREAEALWCYKEIRNEFGDDIESLKAYLRNENNIGIYGYKKT